MTKIIQGIISFVKGDIVNANKKSITLTFTGISSGMLVGTYGSFAYFPDIGDSNLLMISMVDLQKKEITLNGSHDYAVDALVHTLESKPADMYFHKPIVIDSIIQEGK